MGVHAGGDFLHHLFNRWAWFLFAVVAVLVAALVEPSGAAASMAVLGLLPPPKMAAEGDEGGSSGGDEGGGDDGEGEGADGEEGGEEDDDGDEGDGQSEPKPKAKPKAKAGDQGGDQGGDDEDEGEGEEDDRLTALEKRLAKLEKVQGKQREQATDGLLEKAGVKPEFREFARFKLGAIDPSTDAGKADVDKFAKDNPHMVSEAPKRSPKKDWTKGGEAKTGSSRLARAAKIRSKS